MDVEENGEECRARRADKSDRAVQSRFKVRSNSMHCLIWQSPARRPVPCLNLAGAAGGFLHEAGQPPGSFAEGVRESRVSIITNRAHKGPRMGV